MKLSGRVLWLTDDAELVRTQLRDDPPWKRSTEAPPLHFGVNTDAMISGAACTLGYTGEILGPYFLENFKEVVTKDAVRDGGFQVVVGGDAYGSGSSREVAVVAHQGAGIELVVAPANLAALEKQMADAGFGSIQLVPEPSLADGQAYLRVGRHERQIDLAGALERIATAIRALIALNERTVKHA